MAIKTIPNDIVAEQSVLGAMFLSPSAIEKATDKLVFIIHSIEIPSWMKITSTISIIF